MSVGRPDLHTGRPKLNVCSLYLFGRLGRSTDRRKLCFLSLVGRLAVDRSHNGSFASRVPVDRQSTGRPATPPTALSSLGISENLFYVFSLTEFLGVVGVLLQKFLAGKIRVLTFSLPINSGRWAFVIYNKNIQVFIVFKRKRKRVLKLSFPFFQVWFSVVVWFLISLYNWSFSHKHFIEPKFHIPSIGEVVIEWDCL